MDMHTNDPAAIHNYKEPRMLDAGARSRHDVVGTHRSKERLSAAAQRCRAGLLSSAFKEQTMAPDENLAPEAPCGRWRRRSILVNSLLRVCVHEIR